MVGIARCCPRIVTDAHRAERVGIRVDDVPIDPDRSGFAENPPGVTTEQGGGGKIALAVAVAHFKCRNPEGMPAAAESHAVGMLRLILCDEQQAGEMVDESSQRAQRFRQAVSCQGNWWRGQLLQAAGASQAIRPRWITEVEVVNAE